MTRQTNYPVFTLSEDTIWNLFRMGNFVYGLDLLLAFCDKYWLKFSILWEEKANIFLLIDKVIK